MRFSWTSALAWAGVAYVAALVACGDVVESGTGVFGPAPTHRVGTAGGPGGASTTSASTTGGAGPGGGGAGAGSTSTDTTSTSTSTDTGTTSTSTSTDTGTTSTSTSTDTGTTSTSTGTGTWTDTGSTSTSTDTTSSGTTSTSTWTDTGSTSTDTASTGTWTDTGSTSTDTTSTGTWTDTGSTSTDTTSTSTIDGCADLTLNGAETDVDCGGPTCAPCGLGMHCAVTADCASGACSAGVCAPSVVLVNGCDAATATDLTGQPGVTVSFGGAIGMKYSPKCLRVSAGTQVTFAGNFLFHWLQGGEVQNGVEVPAAPGTTPLPTAPSSQNTGTSATFTMTPAGVYGFYCIPHGTLGMNGAIFVE